MALPHLYRERVLLHLYTCFFACKSHGEVILADLKISNCYFLSDPITSVVINVSSVPPLPKTAQDYPQPVTALTHQQGFPPQ